MKKLLFLTFVLIFITNLAFSQATIWSEDFANGIPSGWTNSTAPWVFRGPSTSPGVNTGSQGAYTGTSGPISSPSANNGFVIFDSDYYDNYGTVGNFGNGLYPTPHNGDLKTDMIDLSAYSAVMLNMNSYFRTFQGQAFINFYVNGTYDSRIEVHTNLNINEATDSNAVIMVQIPYSATGVANVQIEFQFEGTTQSNVNGSGYYFWMIDDISLTSNGGGTSTSCSQSNTTTNPATAYPVYSTYYGAADLIVNSGEDFDLTTVKPELWIYGGGTFSSVTLSYYADNSGAPGTLIGSETVTPTSQTSLGTWSGSSSYYRYEVTLNVTPFTFSGQNGADTKYWIGISNVTTTNSSVSLYWGVDNALGGNYYGYTSSGGSSWSSLSYDFIYEFSGNCITAGGSSLKTYVPDDNFEQALIDLGIDTDSILDDSVLTSQIMNLTSLTVSYKYISDLTGIEDFTALNQLYCYANQLTSLDVSNNTALTFLSSSSNQLTSLNVSQNTALTNLQCHYNQLTTLDVSNNTALTFLQCHSNQLTSLDVSQNTALDYLYCNSNQLTSLNVSNNTALNQLLCFNNQLTSLDLSYNTALWRLKCEGNQLTSLDLRNGNNSNMSNIPNYGFNINNNPQLYCIDVDNAVWSTTNWTVANGNIDPWNNFSNNCQNEIYGCTDPNTPNYNPLATIDDGSCISCSELIVLDSKTNLSCNGLNDGMVNVSSSGICVSWYWTDNGSTIGDRQNMSAGTYTLVGTTCNGLCSDSLIVTITEPSVITGIMMIGNESTSGASDGQIDLTASGGTPCATNIQIGSGTVSSFQSYLWYTWYMDGHTEITYPVAELAALGMNSGDIMNELAWNILLQDGAASTTIMNSANLTVNGVNVWSGNHQAVLGMNNFVFTTPVTYTGGDLVVEWCFDNASYFSGNNYFESTMTSGTISNYADLSTTSGCTALVPSTVRSYRPNAYINFASASAYTFDWSNGDTTEDVSNLTSGQYCVVVTDCNGCTAAFCDIVSIGATYGCTDSLSVNYNPFATIDDGSCICCVNGCTDSVAFNYNSNAIVDDGSCYYGMTYVPDDNFEQALINLGIDTDPILDDSVATGNIMFLTYLNVSYNSIADLTGIEDFDSLQTLYCYYNQLTSLNVSQNTALTYLYCYNNQLTSLDVSNNTALTYLQCQANQLTSLDVSQNTALYYLYCNSNQLTSLDLRNGNNINMYYNNNFTSNYNLYCIDVDSAAYSTTYWYNIDPWAGFSNDCQLGVPGCTDSTNINYNPNATVNDGSCIYAKTYVPDDNFENYLEATSMGDGIANNDSVYTYLIAAQTYLNLYNNSIADLTGIEDFDSLQTLYCYYNQLTSLDVSGNTALTYLYCYNNQLTSLDVSQNTALYYLYCNSNQLTSLDVSGNTALYQLYCQNNQLTSLNVSQNTALTYLYCNSNQLTSLDLRNGNNMNMYNGNNFTSNYNLYCIDVDNAAYSTTYWYNIDPWAGFNNNCQLGVPGCTDSTNINYNPNATVNDGSCIYAKTYVPDDYFEARLEAMQMGDGIANNDSVYTFLIDNQTYLNVSSDSIADLTGIEDFDSLQTLYCYYNQLTSLNVSNNTALYYLYCYSNQLTSLDVSGNTALTYLQCQANQLSSLDVSYNTALTYLYCNSNQLTSLDLRNGNNMNMYNGNNFTSNYNLYCIDVDSAAYSTTYWYNIDPWASFSNDCQNEIFGCMDSTALNYNSSATLDDGSCYYSCNAFTSNDTTICLGSSITITPLLSSYMGSLIEDFDNNNLSPLIESISAGYSLGSPCGTSPLGGQHLWFGTGSSIPRAITTIPLSVSNGGIIQFDFRMETQGGVCDGPDQYSEGVACQYKTINGIWTDITYFDASNQSLYRSWVTYTFSIPTPAQTNTTQFRWIQTYASSTIYDFWGIDEIIITDSSSTNLLVDLLWSTGDTASQITVSPSQNTTYWLQILSSTGTVICLDSFYVNLDTCAISLGCTDSIALNFNPNVLIDDGSCYYCSITTNVITWLPTTISACNGFINVITTSGTTPYTYSWSNGNTTALNLNLCDGAYTYTVIDFNGCGFTETVILTTHLGCTDPTSLNYDSTAIVDDGSCIAFVYGCTDSTATNYNPLANTDDGSCIPYIYGCTDNTAINYNPFANTDDGSCTYCYAVVDIVNDSITACDSALININSSTNGFYVLMTFTSGWTYVTVTDSLGCTATDSVYVHIDICGCTDSTALNYNPSATQDDGSCVPIIYGCTDSTALNYYAAGNIDDGSCMYCDIQITQLVTNPNTPGNCDGWAMVQATSSYSTPTYSWSNSFSGSFNMGLCLGMYTVTASDIYGCTVDSTISIGNIVLGCTDSTATNYNAAATVDDGSCTYSTTCNSPVPTGLSVTDLTHNRTKVNWLDANTSVCLVEMYRVQYREQGTTAWSTKTALGSGLCNFGLLTTSKMLWNLTPSTVYEYRVKAWYCLSSASTWSPISTFTTLDPCPNVLNFGVSTPTNTRATFTWTAPSAPYSFVRIKLRVDTTNASWFTAGGFGVMYPALTRNKNGLTAGQSYRASSRTWCNPLGGPHKALAWTPFIYWTQPGTLIRIDSENSAINNLTIFPNPSRDIFNITFISEEKQNLRVRILNVIGEEVYKEDLQQFIGEYVKSINLEQYNKAIYFLEIETDNGVINKKLILQ